MTPLTRPVRRLSAFRHRGRHLVVSLLPGDVLELRQRRARQAYTIPIAWCFDAAVKAHVAAARAAKKLKRKSSP